MRGQVTIVQAVLILLVIVTVTIIIVPWVASSIERSGQISEMQTIRTQMELCNDKIEETGRVGSANQCVFSVGKGKMYAETTGIYYELVSTADICDENEWTEIDPQRHLWQRCDIVADTTVYELRWSWPKELEIKGESLSGSVYRYDSKIADIDFDTNVTFQTLTVFVEFDFIPGQSGNIIEMSRVSVDEDKVTLRVNIR